MWRPRRPRPALHTAGLRVRPAFCSHGIKRPAQQHKMPSCSAEPGAVLKVLAHAAKFPASAINGVLLGCVSGSDVRVTDAIPLCHTSITLAPALEFGLAQVRRSGRQECSHDAIRGCPPLYAPGKTASSFLATPQVQSYTALQGELRIVGYYQSEARFDRAGELTALAKKLADKVVEHTPGAVALILDNKQLEQFCRSQADCPFVLFSKDSTRGWKPFAGGEGSESWLQVAGSDWKRLREDFFSSFKLQMHRTLVDFEDHLDDPAKDWLNKGFGGKLALPGNAL